MNTSAQAFEKVKPAVPSIRSRVLQAIGDAGDAGLTPSQIIAQLGELDYSVRPRITELFLSGQIKKNGQTRQNLRGNEEDVYVYTVGVIQPVAQATPLEKALKAFSNLSREDKRAALSEITISQFDWAFAGSVDYWSKVHKEVGNMPVTAFTESGK
jgi:hypothetical protein